jgi:cyclopropane fatty-acyl-phospholipid synthase-like methyltransferase
MTQCPLCRAEARCRFGLGHTTVWECASRICGLFFADPQLDDRSLADAYASHYYPSNEDGNAAVYENTPEAILRQTFNKAEAELGPLAGKNLLDFGCGVGGLCKVAGEYGVPAMGIEPDASARKKACKSGGLRAYASLGSLREAQPDTKFDIVTMWDVIEHLREPWKVLKDLSDLLQPDGWLLLSTPNAACLRARVERERWENMVNPTHFYYFTRKSLEAVFSRAGFTQISELRFPIQYPRHTIVRRIVHRAIVTCRLQGQLVFVVHPQRPGTAGTVPSFEETRELGAHAGD